MTPTDRDLDRLVEASIDLRIPVADLADGRVGPSTIAAFRRSGVVLVRGLVGLAELQELDAAARSVIDAAPRDWTADHVAADLGGRDGPDLFKVDYLLDKHAAFRRAMANPRLLGLIEDLVGPSLVPTWETLVLKGARRGPRIPWHRDCAVYDSPLAVGAAGRLVDVGIYLDRAPRDNCVRCLPGSCYWPAADAGAVIDRLNETWGQVPGVPILAAAGDAVLHNVLTLHSAPEVSGSERRVLYYEFRPAEVEVELGPHTVQFVAEKQRILTSCIEERRSSPLGIDEVPHPYQPPAAMDYRFRASSGKFRIQHSDHWTWDHVEPIPP